MTDAELEAHVIAMTNTFIDSAVDGEVSAEAQMEFVKKLWTKVKKFVVTHGQLIVPIVALLVAIPFLKPYFSNMMNGAS